MKNFNLSTKEVADLKNAHKQKTLHRYEADRIKSIVLLGTGWTLESVSEALLLDTETLRNYVKKYRDGGIKVLLTRNYQGKESRLTRQQLNELKIHLDEKTYMDVASIIAYVKKQYNETYKSSGMRNILKKLGFSYKKPTVIPGKMDPVAQLKYLQKYEKLRRSGNPLYFMDGVHPQHNSQPNYGWILKGKEKALRSNTGRKRLNINGALNIDTLELMASPVESLNKDNTINFFKKILKKHKNDKKIYIICDNAAYYRNKEVTKFLKKIKKIELVFLPAYCPHLNLIERVWKYFKKMVVYNQYYETFQEFKYSCMNFFKRRHKKKLKKLLTEKFHFGYETLSLLNT